MSENTTNDEILPATLEEGESVIPQDSADKFQALIDEIKNPTATEITAEQFGIKVSKPKAMPETDGNNVIGSSETTKTGGVKKSNITVDGDNVLSSKSANRKDPVKEPAKTNKKVAIYSSRNVTINGVGKVYRGYNIVTEEHAKVWLKRDHVRLATPEEVAEEFGK